jgi:membrane fusion protein, multidrug efflux system
VQPGEFIKEDTPVITLVQMDPLKVITAAQEKFAGVIQPGMSIQFRVESYPNDTFRGRIVSVSPAVDQSTRTFAVEAELPNADHRLKPGFFAKGAILTHVDANVVAAPEDAVSTLAGVSTVYVIENGKVRPQNVTVGVHQDNLIEIVEGLHGSETVATSNLNQLSAGVAVTARRVTP